MRLYYLVVLFHTSHTTPKNFAEAYLKATTLTMQWSYIETCISIIAACLPTLGPLLRKGRRLTTILRRCFSVLSSPFTSEASAKTSGKHSNDTDATEYSSRAWQRIRGSPSHITEIRRGSDVELADGIHVHTSVRSEAVPA